MDRNVIVTGGSRGLGLAIAEAIANDGFQVIAVARAQSDSFNAAQLRVTDKGFGSLIFHNADLADLQSIPDHVKTIRKTYGGLFGLVNNAGIGSSGLLTNMSDSTINAVIQLNIHSPIILTKYAARSMMTTGSGRIVNLSSIVASNGYSGLAAYSATKAGLIGFTRSLARELGPLGINVNAIAPGFVETDMTRTISTKESEQIARRSALKRMAEMTDIAAAASFLFSEKARNITGTVITVDAGGTA